MNGVSSLGAHTHHKWLAELDALMGKYGDGDTQGVTEPWPTQECFLLFLTVRRLWYGISIYLRLGIFFSEIFAEIYHNNCRKFQKKIV